jgi:hypothetical protein
MSYIQIIIGDQEVLFKPTIDHYSLYEVNNDNGHMG